MAIRTHVPWYLRIAPLLTLALAALLAAALVAGPFGSGSNDAAAELAALRGRVDTLEDELVRHRSAAQAAGSTLQIERTTREQFEQQLKQLEAENIRLRQDLSLFESLTEIDRTGADASITGFAVEPEDAPGHYRYRMLIAVRGANKSEREREFHGQLQFVVKLWQQDKAAIMNFPMPDDPRREEFRLKFKHFQRVDGSFEVPGGAQVTSVEVRLLENGTTKVAKVFNLG